MTGAHNESRGVRLAAQVEVAKSPLARMRGLLGREGLSADAALLIDPCNSIHTFFMAFPIDALFLDGDQRVVATYRALPPWRLTRIVFRARSVLELPAGVLEATGTSLGDKVRFTLPA